MTAQEAIRYIENCGWSTTRLGLDRTRELLRALGDPQKQLRFVHVAGSNGKGSTCAMLDQILRDAGYRVGLYTSPYIQTFGERMRVDGENVSDEDLARLTERVRDIAEAMEDHPSQFELVTAIAMQYFLEQGCDIVVLEVGMGGALDSTNAIDAPEVAVITNIGLEHTEYLGDTLEAIAETKAGIIKTGCDCVCYDGAPEVTDVIRRVCEERGVPLTIADFGAERLETGLFGQRFRLNGKEYSLSLLGAHQLKNAAVALAVVDRLRARGWEIPEQAVESGLRNVKWPARLEILAREPLFILDGGHNPQCAEALAASVSELLPGQKAVFLLGVLADKDYGSVIDFVAPLAERFVCLTPVSDRALTGEKLAEYLRGRGLDADAAADIPTGIRTALYAGNALGCPVICFGSLYLAGAVRTAFPGEYRKWLRKEKIRRREALNLDERDAGSAAVCQAILASPEFKAAHTVMLYRGVRGETRLTALEQAPEAAGKVFCYPLCLEDGEMIAVRPAAGEDGWRPGAFGIPEPAREKGTEIPPEEIDLVICPLTAFDEQCRRLGMGGGYYDRFLPRCRNAKVAAAAFRCQRTEEVPAEPWDVAVDVVFTEDAVYRK